MHSGSAPSPRFTNECELETGPFWLTIKKNTAPPPDPVSSETRSILRICPNERQSRENRFERERRDNKQIK